MARIEKTLYVKSIHPSNLKIEFTEEYFYINDDSTQDPFIKEAEIQKGDRIYFAQGCTVPRFRIRSALQAKGASICKDVSNASVIFASDKTIDHFSTSHWLYYVKTDYFIQWLEKAYFKGSYLTLPLILRIDELKPDRIALSSFVITDCIGPNSVLGKLPIFDTEPQWFCDIMVRKRQEQGYDYQESRDQENPCQSRSLQALNEGFIKDSIAGLSKARLLSESIAQSMMNSESVVIDQEIYEQLRDMFNSSDDSNIPLAMEMMAGCDYEKSYVYIGLLIEEFHSVMNSTRNKDHVAFKSLLKFFEISSLYYVYSLEELLSKMIRKRILTKEMLDILIPLFEKRTQDNSGMKLFEIKLVPKPELLDAIDTIKK